MNKVSVCMATYNGAKYIKQQLDSILTQLSPDDEIIVSDDGSSDDTVLIVNSYNDSRIKLIINATGIKGPVGNFGNALSHSSNEYIFLADQDDLWVQGKLEKHVELMQQYELVISDARVVDENGAVLFDSYFTLREVKHGVVNNLIKNSFLGCCMSFRRSLLDRVLPFPKYIHMHDWWIGLVAELNGNTFFCDEKLLIYRRHNNNATATFVKGLSISKKIANRTGFAVALLLRKFRGVDSRHR